MKNFLSLLCSIIVLSTVVGNAHAGKIVLANDEWTLSDTGFSGSTNDPGRFATNVASWFAGAPTGNFLAYSSNFGLTGSQLNNAMTSAGNTWTVSTAASALANLSSYDGVFLSGNPVDNDVLINYVNAGGNVYLAGGTGWGGAAAEAAQWNAFLNNFGLGFGSVYNGVCCSIAIASTHEIFNGVDSLYQNNGNNALDISADSRGQILVSQNGQGLYAVYDSGSVSVPEPTSAFLLGAGLIGLVCTRRKINKF